MTPPPSDGVLSLRNVPASQHSCVKNYREVIAAQQEKRLQGLAEGKVQRMKQLSEETKQRANAVLKRTPPGPGSSATRWNLTTRRSVDSCHPFDQRDSTGKLRPQKHMVRGKIETVRRALNPLRLCCAPEADSPGLKGFSQVRYGM